MKIRSKQNNVKKGFFAFLIDHLLDDNGGEKMNSF